ncbi:hypothetical protein J2X04_000958 [Lysobacter niabensis]|uniref:Uncharacterized protein n=1 Tax=Agrilutibacter niabensis TaxID=380628 RepID=A0ABU1VMA5_9GAMM|nr:hypothetical protein [Lysobacter niabensis]MDR7098611.1 hypothetical protein [Lysobacter niabensis]
MKLLLELARQYKGNNNGDLSATVNMLRNRGFASKDTLPTKLKWLENHGWIVRTRQGGRHVGCNLYAITWWTLDECPGKHSYQAERKPSHLWKIATGVPPDGEPMPVPRGGRRFAPRQTGNNIVHLHSLASKRGTAQPRQPGTF